MVVVFLITLASISTTSNAKRKWIVVKKLGNVNISHYTPASNTPRGSRHTSSGRTAKENHTIAVDYRHQIAKMYQKVRIRYKTKKKHRKKTVIYTVEDYGGFWKYGRAFDVFTCISGQGIVTGNAEIVRRETKKEYKARLRREEKEREQARKLKQQGWFILEHNDKLESHQVITDPNYIKSGSISFGGGWFDVVKTKRGLKNIIQVNFPFAKDFDIVVKLDAVEEGAVG